MSMNCIAVPQVQLPQQDGQTSILLMLLNKFELWGLLAIDSCSSLAPSNSDMPMHVRPIVETIEPWWPWPSIYSIRDYISDCALCIRVEPLLACAWVVGLMLMVAV